MEQKVFPAPAVAGELGKHWVEARLHTDGPPREEENKALQVKLTGMRANPVDLFQNPNSREVAHQENGAVLNPEKFASLVREHRDAVLAD
jgi:hypothetical protein